MRRMTDLGLVKSKALGDGEPTESPRSYRRVVKEPLEEIRKLYIVSYTLH